MARNERFGGLLSEGIASVARRQHKTVAEVEQAIGEQLGYTHHNIQHWRRGYPPKEPEHTEFLVRYCVSSGRMDREWVQSLLIQIRYPDHDELLRELFPEHIARPVVPRIYDNLPPRYGDFLGRQEDMARVLEGLTSRWPLISIEGLGGMGKTTLAIESAHHCLPGAKAMLDPPFEAVVWVSAKDRPEQKRWLNDVLDAVARVLDYPYITQLPLEQKRAEVDKLFHVHRALLIVDNFETMEDSALVSWMQRVPEPSKLLITCRYPQLRGVWAIHLAGLAEPEALELVRRHARRLGLAKLEGAAENDLTPLVHVTDGNPKAIEMALGYIKRGMLSLSAVVDHLHSASKTVGDIFDYLFTQAWGLLTDDSQHLLLVTPFFMDTAGKEAIGAAAGLSGYRLDVALGQLVEMSLLDVSEEIEESMQRYSAHPLTRFFANSKLGEAPVFETEARRRWCEYFLNFAERHIKRDIPKERYWNCLMGRDLKQAESELHNLLRVLAWADQNKEHEILIELMMLWTHYLMRYAFPERIRYAQKAVEAAHQLGRKEDEALFRIDALGWSLIESGLLADATREISIGLRIAQSICAGSTDGNDLTALAQTFLARVYLLQEEVAEASALVDKAKSTPCLPVIRSRVTLTAGDLAYNKHDYSTAIRLYEEVIRIEHEYGGEDPSTESRYRLCIIYLERGNIARAEAELKEIIDVKQQISRLDNMYAQYGLARIAQAKGDADEARQLAQDALDTLSRWHIDHRLQKEIEAFLIGLDTS